MEPMLEIALMLIVIGAMSVIAYFLGLLTVSGAIASFVTGGIIGAFGSLGWFILLLVFTVAGFIATKMGIDRKKAEGLQEGQHGERTYKNVLGVALAPCIISVVSFIVGDGYDVILSIGFIASISVAAADTIASEIGVRDKKVWLCTSFERVAPGTDGGISALGTVAALIGSFGVSVLGWVILYQEINWLILIPTLAGFLGCYADSLLGATLETRGYISKYVNNASTGLIGAVIAVAIAWPLI